MEPVRDALAHLRLPDHLADRLTAFAELVRDVAVPRGFVADGDADHVVERHVLDSLRAVAVLTEDDLRVADVGSGAGLPGIVLAVVRPATAFVLIEPKRARGAFIELAIDRLGLRNVEVRIGRVEDVTDRGTFDVVVARAFAPPERAWAAVAHLLRPDGRMVLFAGAEAQIPEALPGATSVRIEAPGLPVLESPGALIIISR